MANKLIEVPLDKCKWCSGSGTEQQDYLPPVGIRCVDCNGTGFKNGKAAEEYQDVLIEEEYRNYLKKQENKEDK